MRAVVVARPGQDNPFDLADVPLPEPGPAEVRIRVHASTINRVDLMILNGFMHHAGYIPADVIPGVGNDVAGIIDQLGAGVTQFAVGDRVAGEIPAWGTPGRYGSHAEYVVMPVRAIAPIPDSLGFAAAATIPLNGLTARQALDRIPQSSSRRLLVTGAAGAVGGYAIALAARGGWEVTAHARSSDEEFTRKAGARHLVTSSTGIGKFDAMLDAAGLGDLTLLRDGGFYSGIGSAVGMAEPTRGITVSEIHTQPDGAQVADLLTLAATGQLEVRIAGTVTLAQVATGFAHVDAGSNRGRWVVLA